MPAILDESLDMHRNSRTGNLDVAAGTGQAYAKTDALFANERFDHVGSTCSLIVVTNGRAFFTNAGDSLAMVAFNDGNLRIMSAEHKVGDPAEMKRILDLGGPVTESDTWRVGGLNVARGFGDRALKKWVVSTPYICSAMTKDIRYIVNASDGLWDAVDRDDLRVVDDALEDVSIENCASKIRALIELAQRRGSTDNITVSVVLFNV
ncbi:hypothetical protein FOA52_004151 [Chlamydomonas sp. UWO 241]|nr:hypothetical protein FOA52_004151 [Chlamydomonas sp. UWO 241]